MLTVYGSTPVANRMLRWADSKHDGVEGSMPDGSRYAARSPDSIMWIHVIAMGSILRAYQRYRRPLSAADADRYWEELSFIPRHLGGIDDPPRSQEDAAAWLRDIRPQLAVTMKGRRMLKMMARPFEPDHPFGRSTFTSVEQVLGDLTRLPGVSALPGMVNRTLGVASWPVVQAAIGLVPAWARDLLGLRQPRMVDLALVRPAAFTLFTAARGVNGTPMPVERARARLAA